MTQQPELSQETKERIAKEAELFGEEKGERIYDVKEYWTCSDIQNGYEAGATAYATQLQQLHSYTEKIKELLRFTDCPELIIENPDFIKGKKPTDEDMEWARAKVKEYIAVEKSKDEQIAGLREALQEIITCIEVFSTEPKVFEIKRVATEALKQ